MKRLLLLLLTLVMVLSTFVACGPDTPADTTQGASNETEPTDTTTDLGGDTTTETTTTTTEEPDPGIYVPEEGFETPDTITIKVEEDKVNYRIIRSQNAESVSAAVKQASALASSFLDFIGKAPESDTDWPRKNNSDTLEILIGQTDYDETAAVIDNIKYGEYIIKAVGNKIVIMGYSNDAIETGVKEFLNICRANRDKATKTITVSAEALYLKGTVNETLNELPVLGGNTTAQYYDAGLRTQGQNCDMVVMSNTSIALYSSYQTKLTEKGFKQYVSTEMGKNKFSTYTKDRYTVTLGYFTFDKTIRVTIETDAPAVGLASENKYTKVTTSQLSMLGQEHKTDGTQNGLSELIRLEDGRFIVIDGGHSGAQWRDAFIAEIKRQAKEYGNDNPVIAAWILTHPHSDHDALFYAHAKEIKDKGITVERVLMNAVSSEEELDRLYALGVSSTVLYAAGSIDLSLSAAAAIGATVHKVHTGQVFHFANAKIEVLYTHETQYPNKMPNINDTSLIMKFTFTDSVTGKQTTFLSTGDATGPAFKCVDNNFGDYLSCDILSMAHHGGTTGSHAEYTRDTYKIVDPTLALWPAGVRETVFRAYNSEKTVATSFFAQENLKEIYIAGYIGDATIIPLPYVVGNVKALYTWDIVNEKPISAK